MGQNVVSPKQLRHIMRNAKIAYDKHGMDGMLRYLQHITNAPVSTEELKQFAHSVHRSGPEQAMKWFKR